MSCDRSNSCADVRVADDDRCGRDAAFNDFSNSKGSCSLEFTFMVTCAAGTEFAVVDEIINKVLGTVLGPFQKQRLDLNQRDTLLKCRRSQEPSCFDYSIHEALNTSFVRENADSSVREISAQLAQEGVVIFSTNIEPYDLVHQLKCVKAVYAFLCAEDIPTHLADVDLRYCIAMLVAQHSLKMDMAARAWRSVHLPFMHNSRDGNYRINPEELDEREISRKLLVYDALENATAVSPVEGHVDLNNITNINESRLKFRATLEKHTSKSYSITSPKLAGSLGAGLQARYGWPVDLTNYDVEIYAYLTDLPRAAFVGLALTDFRHANNRYRHRFGQASLQTYIAASLLRIAQPQPGMVIYDNMCGTGTIPIEGAHEYPDCVFVGSDIDVDSIEIAEHNIRHLKNCKAASRVSVFLSDGTISPFDDESIDMIISDLPWGRRCGSASSNRRLYPCILREWYRILQVDGEVYALTLERNLMRRLVAQLQQKSPFEIAEEIIIDIGHKVSLFKIKKLLTERPAFSL